MPSNNLPLIYHINLYISCKFAIVLKFMYFITRFRSLSSRMFEPAGPIMEGVSVDR